VGQQLVYCHVFGNVAARELQGRMNSGERAASVQRTLGLSKDLQKIRAFIPQFSASAARACGDSSPCQVTLRGKQSAWKDFNRSARSRWLFEPAFNGFFQGFDLVILDHSHDYPGGKHEHGD
jgi:hypothetical protein